MTVDRWRIQHVDERVYDVATTIKSRSVNSHNVPPTDHSACKHIIIVHALSLRPGFRIRHPQMEWICATTQLAYKNAVQCKPTQLSTQFEGSARLSTYMQTFVVGARGIFTYANHTKTDTAKTCPQTTAREKQQPLTTTTTWDNNCPPHETPLRAVAIRS